MRILAACLLATVASAVVAAPPGKRTYANPIDIDYRYNWEQTPEQISYRTGADPAIVRHKGAYYLFQTLADGYWRSTDLATWTFITPSRWPFRGIVAPAAWSDGERLYLMPSMTDQGVILVSDAPETGKLEFLTRRLPPLPGMVRSGFEDSMKPGQVPPGPWDPALFKDDDARWYMYWNSSNVFPLYAIELDPKNRLSYIGKPKPLFGLEPGKHGWERFGQDHSGTLPNGTPIKPFMEGAWMTKVGGRYYLQYGAPGTEYNVYGNGTYVSKSPMGPFEYAPYNPVAYKPGGFVEGAGHGSTFQDNNGNWWNTGTPWIGYNWTFERRIGMWPAHFYPDGQMMVSTRFGDFPHYAPDGPNADPEALFTGWMLLSYRAMATASSTMGEFAAARATDENPRTFWVAGANKAGETLTLDLGRAKEVRALQVNFADYKSGRFGDAPDIYTEFRVEASGDGKSWRKVAETEAPRRDRPNAYFELAKPVRARFVRYVHGHVGAANLAISDIRVFGKADGAAPSAPGGVTAVREKDQRNARVTWTAAPGATGYNVRWGVRPDRLTLTYQLFADDAVKAGKGSLALRSLNVGVGYHVAVEAFNEAGVSELSNTVAVR
ncbi:family 43 glycosylhydrolase [Sphingomonas sp. SUN019]|uniref:family 43 glycosylhydrolase n=1 Tax=Sphingomonas sp. SUN019 TaxID=2937788 RepID=UPI0021641060|nr:family 43 glycosylhydrolase [Sphingomonas sp. SUN019]UVO49723.1 family 43 glycosylhydrolase [Sphingomonas sp. SUN019]